MKALDPQINQLIRGMDRDATHVSLVRYGPRHVMLLLDADGAEALAGQLRDAGAQALPTLLLSHVSAIHEAGEGAQPPAADRPDGPGVSQR